MLWNAIQYWINQAPTIFQNGSLALKVVICQILLSMFAQICAAGKIVPLTIHLTCHFSLNQTSSFYEEFLFSIFFGLYITTTFPCNLHKMIDPIDPRSHPQGVPQFQAQYIKLNTPVSIAILIIFTCTVANEVLWNISWVEDMSWPLKLKNGPKKGQNFWKRKIFNFSY